MCVKQINLILIIIPFITTQTQGYRRLSFDIINIDVLYDKLGFNLSDCVSSEIPILHNKQRGKVRKIESTNQTIPTLPEKMIVDFLRLEKITLSGNNITTIETGAFTNLPLLNSVNLSDNKIVAMKFSIFIDVPSLRQVHLENNRLFYFEQAWMGYVPSLEWLNLNYNLLKTITVRSFSNFPNLLYLNLAHNQIVHIDDGGFSHVNHLKILDLSYNRIKHLHANVFAPIRGLHVLNLYSNEINYISDKVLNNLSDLHEIITLFNPWQCGCYDKLVTWAQIESVRLNKNKYFKCMKTQDIDNIPKCVICATSSEIDCAQATDDLCDILYSQLSDFECSFEYAKYLGL